MKKLLNDAVVFAALLLPAFLAGCGTLTEAGKVDQQELSAVFGHKERPAGHACQERVL